ncbi:phage tail tape measure protein [Anaerotignum sp. MB30-C6]|uniref:phage tail tape measure protein n=1 Tax=Anaerotignum sp. MB30-C6 TaxID=3070814 RepID=UPI0027DCE6C4|nr:phage tail tape measure protein [Anaerotignum sp. MB30-C6]WMI81849.1 phage tail tape measure protein [Anaerotignum sp. MB30-C6]
MAYSYDGYLRFNTEVDQSGFNEGVSGMRSAATLGAKAIAAGIATATGAVTALSVASIKVGSNFEEGMSKVAAISGATGKDLEALTEKAKEMGAVTKFSATESAEALQYMAMAGWKTESMLEGLPGVMNLAAASGEDLGTVSDIVTDALTAFGLQAEESAHFADVLAAASSNANTNVGMMGYTFKYAAPLAGALGYTIEDTALAIGLMANAGIKSETAGTALRSMFSEMTGAVELTGDKLGKYVIELERADGTMVPLGETIRSLREAFSQMTEAEKIANAESLVGKEAMSGLLAIVNASQSDYNKLSAAIQNADGSAQNMADTMNDNLKGDLTILGSTAESVGIRIYDKFETPMRNAAKAATESMNDVLRSLNGGQLDESVDKIAESAGRLLEKTAELTASGLPKLINGFAFVVDHGKEVERAILSISAAYGVMVAASTVQKWQAVTAAAEAYRVAMVASMGITTTSATATALLTTMMSTQEIVVGALTGKVGLHTAATILARRAQIAWNASMFANPVFLVAGGIAALTAGLVYYTSKQKEANAATEEMIKSTNDTVAAWNEAKETRMENIQSQVSELQTTKDMIDELGRLTDAHGKVGDNKERVAYLTEKINEILPDSIKWIDDETVAIDGNIESLKKQIELRQAKILLGELEAQAVEDRKARTEVLKSMLAKEEEIVAREAELEQLRIDLTKAGSNNRIAFIQQEITEKQNQLDELKTAFDTEKAHYEDLNQSISDAVKLGIAIQQGDFEEIGRIMVQKELQLKAAGDSTNAELTSQIAEMQAMFDLLRRTEGENSSEAIKEHIAQISNLLNEYKAELDRRTPDIANSMKKSAETVSLSYADGLVTPYVLNKIQENAGVIGNTVRAGILGALTNTTALATDDISKKAAAQMDALNNRISSAKASSAARDAAHAVAREAQKAQEAALSAMNSGISRAASSASKSAAKSGISIGTLYAENIIGSITQSTGAIQDALTNLSDDAIKTAREKATSYKELGTHYISFMKDGVNTQTDSLIEQMEKLVDEQVETLSKKNKVAKSEYEKAAKEVMDTYKEALKKGASEANTLLAEKIQGITEEAQKQYDEIIKQRERMQEKLSDFGDLFTRDDDGEVQLENIDKQIDAIERYEEALEKLQEKGIAEGLLNEIVNMGVEDGTDFAEELLSKSDSTFERYNQAWTEKQELAKKVAEKFYADELETLDKDFTQKLDTALASIPEECTNVGVDAIKGVIDGMESQRSEAISTAKSIADAIIKELKRATETASPSKRAAREVGKPITQGVVKGMKDAYNPKEMERYADRMMADVGMAQSRAAAQSILNKNISNVWRTSTYNEGDFNPTFNIKSGDKETVRNLMQESEFYRRKKARATGGA